jgi:hypothetical protein
VAALNSSGVNLDIVNYWPVIAGTYYDYVGGDDLKSNGAAFANVADRLANANGAFQTAGAASYAYAPTDFYFKGSSFSITMWVNMPITAQKVLMDFSNSVSGNNVIIATNTAGTCTSKAFMQVFNNAVSSTTCSSASGATNTWYHLATTYNILTLTSTIYVNGVLIGSTGTQQQVRNVSRNNNYFGRDSAGNHGNFRFDEIKFHSRELSAAEVSSDYANNRSYIWFI